MPRGLSNAVLDSILNLPVKYRNRFRRSVSPPKKARETRVFSREELLDYMRRNNIRSPQKLDSFRVDGDPIPNSYKKEFGSWREATVAAFGKPVVKPAMDKVYMAKCAMSLGIETFDQYRQVRKNNPEILPSVCHIIKEFGSFSEFMVDVKACSFKDTLNAYLVLCRRLGKIPTLDDCARAGIKIDILTYRVFDDKKELDSWVKCSQKVWRKNER